MSKQMLRAINGGRVGAFHSWLAGLQREPRLAWYPSAGSDFRDLLYLSPEFAAHMPASQPEPAAPDLFVHTDYHPCIGSLAGANTGTVLDDGRTRIIVESLEELPPLSLPLDGRTIDCSCHSSSAGRMFYLELSIHSRQLGDVRRRMLYLGAENAAFLAGLALLNAGRFSHVVHVRFGGGCGGGNYSSGEWLKEILSSVGCEMFVSDGSGKLGAGDQQVFRCFPNLDAVRRPCLLTPIRTLPGAAWSDHGDVTWNRVVPA